MLFNVSKSDRCVLALLERDLLRLDLDDDDACLNMEKMLIYQMIQFSKLKKNRT